MEILLTEDALITATRRVAIRSDIRRVRARQLRLRLYPGVVHRTRVCPLSRRMDIRPIVRIGRANAADERCADLEGDVASGHRVRKCADHPCIAFVEAGYEVEEAGGYIAVQVVPGGEIVPLLSVVDRVCRESVAHGANTD